MSTIESVSSYTDLVNQPQTTGNSELGKEAFLNLLVTQLQYQDPLEPTKNEEFVAQLAQFSSLEQLTTANDALESLYLAMSSMNNASMTQLLGKEVTAYGDTFHYSGEGETELAWDSSAAVDGATLTITDENGKVVHTEALGAISEGEGSYTWDGSTISGTAAEGDYTFSVTATGEGSEGVEILTMISGEIDGMSFETGVPIPSIEGVELDLGDIVDVRIPGEPVDEDAEVASASRRRR
jgi:flagellar basal-body rod modification protein FlgD